MQSTAAMSGSVSLSARTENYGEEVQMTGLVGEGRPVDIAFLDFSKAFDTVSHKIFMYKLLMYTLDEEREMDWNLAEQQGPKGGDQWHKV